MLEHPSRAKFIGRGYTGSTLRPLTSTSFNFTVLINFCVNHNLSRTKVVMDRFHIFEKRSFRFKNDKEKTIVNDLLKRKYIFWSEFRGQKAFITLSS